MDTHTDYEGLNPDATINAASSILATVFEQNGWTWARTGAEKIPTEEEISNGFAELRQRVIDGADVAETGRLVVMMDHDEDCMRLFLDLGSIYTPEELA